MPEIMIAIRPGTVYIDGRRRMVRKGRTTAHSTHPIVVNHPRMWAPIQVDYPAQDDDADLVEVSTFGSSDPEFLSTTPTLETATINPVEATTAEPTPEPKPADVRAWAREEGIEVSASGKVAADVVERYKAAHA
ncbi:MAG TPA: histone-like nucleoid-structuring protein Lsr2 [Candidatus Limnocylindrales bacterium]